MGAITKFDRSPRWPVGETASATDFVRHFGQYAATSLRQPVYITQHGRVNWALVNADMMAELATVNTDKVSTDVRFDIILDNIASHVIVLDENLNMTRMNAAARRHFQLPAESGHAESFTSLLRDSTQAYLIDVCRRVRDSGNPESFEIDSLRYPGRTLNIQITPAFPDLILTADVVSQTVQVRRAYAEASAAASAADVTGLIGRGRVNVRGTITTASQTLSELAHTTIEKITGLRLASLFEQESRDAVRNALEDLLTDGASFSMDATLLDGTGKNTPVKLGAGAERDAGSISGAAFVVIACG